MKVGRRPPRQSVTSGKFVVRLKTELSLEAHLGTCVGVTICDRTAEVGGLIHLLLPAWTGVSKPWRPEVYAETGLPMFIQALCDEGASTERMEACIAGGALVGPVSNQDLVLDIGGRTEEVVRKVLAEERIPIRKAETGGYFSCKLSLDMVTLDSTIEPIAPETDSPREILEEPIPEDIVASFDLLRPIPQVALKIVRMIHDDQYRMDSIAEEIKRDQVISAGVIRLCNSTYFGLKNRVDSIDRALVIIGEKRLLQMVVSASLELFFSDAGRGYSLCKGGLFQHAFGTAIVAEELARFTGRSQESIAYTAGLLHDIGKVALDQHIALASPFFYRRTQVDMVELCEVETQRLGLAHTEAGGMLAASWSLPENLTDTIRHHHAPEQASVDSQLTHLVYLADLLMSRFQVGQELECLNVEGLDLRMQALGLTVSQLPVLVDLIPENALDAAADGADLFSGS